MTKPDNKKVAQTKTAITKKAMIEALEKSLGIVTKACKIVGISRQTHYVYLNEDEEYRKKVEDVDNLVIDFAESKLHSNINANDTTAIIFYLKTKGKKRGYVERQEIETVEKKPIQVRIKYGNND